MNPSGRHATALCVVAAQRAGTTALGSTLGASGQFHNFGEIFHVVRHYRKTWPYVFPNFAASKNLTLENFYETGDVESVAGQYLDHLVEVAGTKIPLLDVKFNSWQMLRPAWSWPDEEPLFMRVLKGRGCAFIFIRRRDLTEQILSTSVARKSGVWHGAKGDDPPPEKFDVSLPQAKATAEAIVRAESLFDRALRDYPLAHSIAYEDLFASDNLAESLVEFLGHAFDVPASCMPPVQIQKNATEKRRFIGNYDAVKSEVEGVAKLLNRANF